MSVLVCMFGWPQIPLNLMCHRRPKLNVLASQTVSEGPMHLCSDQLEVRPAQTLLRLAGRQGT